MSDFKGVGEHETGHDMLNNGDKSERDSQRTRQSKGRNQDGSKMVKKKERNWRGSGCFEKPLYLRGFLQGWAQAEIGEAEQKKHLKAARPPKRSQEDSYI